MWGYPLFAVLSRTAGIRKQRHGCALPHGGPRGNKSKVNLMHTLRGMRNILTFKKLQLTSAIRDALIDGLYSRVYNPSVFQQFFCPLHGDAKAIWTF